MRRISRRAAAERRGATAAVKHAARWRATAAGLTLLGAAIALAPAISRGANDPGTGPLPSEMHAVGPPFRARAAVRPLVVGLGERVLYRGGVSEGGPASMRLLPPETGGALTWGTPRVFGRHGWERREQPQPYGAYWDLDTMAYEVPLQAFALGVLSIPGLRFEIDDGRGPRIHRLPTVRLIVVPVLTAADSNAEFRAVQGPIAAPWWERVPWGWVALGLVGVAALVVLTRWRRRVRRVRPTVPAPVSRRGEAMPDPLAEALAALAALRALHLPENGRFAEHAFGLGQILRRFLEAVTGVTRPGDTTPELVAHLRLAGLEAEGLARLSGLLRVWDQVKFAREALTLEEAVLAERAVEDHVRRSELAPSQRAA